jgi:hypothetical protein
LYRTISSLLSHLIQPWWVLLLPDIGAEGGVGQVVHQRQVAKHSSDIGKQIGVLSFVPRKTIISGDSPRISSKYQWKQFRRMVVHRSSQTFTPAHLTRLLMAQ